MSAELQHWRVEDFEQWRAVARWLLQNAVPPQNVIWHSGETQESLLPAATILDLKGQINSQDRVVSHVPAPFLTLAERIACHADSARWSLLYSALWRLTHGERYLLEFTTDALTSRLHRMEKQITRDCHKMKAFVRFSKVAEEPHDIYVAWYHPDHDVLKLVAPFFSRRFKAMDWTILTPFASVHWDGRQLQYGAGVTVDQAPREDELVTLWRDYYRSTFNPARLKIKAMKREMPVRFWKHLPETNQIPEMLREAPERVKAMHLRSSQMMRSAEPFIPNQPTLGKIAEALNRCEGCELCRNGTRAVPGSGHSHARLVIVGEQPGDIEEQQGIPFVGPAGELLNQLLIESGIDRTTVFVTNVVKHFHHELRGKRRLHQRPSARHEAACKPWLAAEIEIIRPDFIIGLGVTALHALLGRQHRLGEVIGNSHRTWAADETYFAWHPASILRAPEPLAGQRRAELLEALRVIQKKMNASGPR